MAKKRYTIPLEGDTEDILLRVYGGLGISDAGHTEKLGVAIDHLANTWDAMQDDEPEAEQPAVDMQAIIDRLSNPDIGLDLKVTNTTSPRDSLDGLVPWDYIVQRHPNLIYLKDEDDSERTEAEQFAIRYVLTRTPESAWGSTHTISVVGKALLEVIAPE